MDRLVIVIVSIIMLVILLIIYFYINLKKNKLDKYLEKYENNYTDYNEIGNELTEKEDFKMSMGEIYEYDVENNEPKEEPQTNTIKPIVEEQDNNTIENYNTIEIEPIVEEQENNNIENYDTIEIEPIKNEESVIIDNNDYTNIQDDILLDLEDEIYEPIKKSKEDSYELVNVLVNKKNYIFQADNKKLEKRMKIKLLISGKVEYGLVTKGNYYKEKNLIKTKPNKIKIIEIIKGNN